MADENEKTKTTVPGMVRTPKGVAEHAAAVLAQQWDKDRKVFRDPITTMMALFTYAKLTAALLDEEGTRLMLEIRARDKRIEALEKRIAEFETRLSTVERWKDEKDAEAALMIKGFEEMMGGDETSALKNLKSILSGDSEAPSLVAPTTIVVPPKLVVAPAEPNGEHEKKDDVA